MTAIEEMMATAAGIEKKRGDTITVDTLPFESTSAQDKKALEEQQRWNLYMDFAKIGAALLGLGLVLFFLRRSFKRLEDRVPMTTVLPRGSEFPQLASPLPLLGNMVDSQEPESFEMDEVLDMDEIRRRKQVEQLAREQPEVVARVIQRWLVEGS
ncbi:MAG: hypothetical protein A2Z04_00060 [Chloroflexi bacterium RBG_16_57_9]|nr:MAG: hypothetical protein A2Z04_00060 [Chloroflexi bacterium RBG_16_57_9]